MKKKGAKTVEQVGLAATSLRMGAAAAKPPPSQVAETHPAAPDRERNVGDADSAAPTPAPTATAPVVQRRHVFCSIAASSVSSDDGSASTSEDDDHDEVDGGAPRAGHRSGMPRGARGGLSWRQQQQQQRSAPAAPPSASASASARPSLFAGSSSAVLTALSSGRQSLVSASASAPGSCLSNPLTASMALASATSPSLRSRSSTAPVTPSAASAAASVAATSAPTVAREPGGGVSSIAAVEVAPDRRRAGSDSGSGADGPDFDCVGWESDGSSDAAAVVHFFSSSRNSRAGGRGRLSLHAGEDAADPLSGAARHPPSLPPSPPLGATGEVASVFLPVPTLSPGGAGSATHSLSNAVSLSPLPLQPFSIISTTDVAGATSSATTSSDTTATTAASRDADLAASGG